MKGNRLSLAFLLAALVSSLAACADGDRPSRQRIGQIDWALQGAPGVAQPSRVIARELAFARELREQGMTRAMRKFAADGARHTSRRPGMIAPDSYDIVKVWISCDSTLAATQARFKDADGFLGTAITIWQRGTDDEYRWIDYEQIHSGVAEAAESQDADPDAIVVRGVPDIQGIVADCVTSAGLPLLPEAVTNANDITGQMSSSDYTLRYYRHETADARRVAVWQVKDGSLQNVIDLPILGDGKSRP